MRSFPGATTTRLASAALAATLLLGACDMAALGTGRTDCGQLASVECREALLLAAAELGPAPGDVIADRTCVTADGCPSPLDWIVVYPLGDGEAVALRMIGSEPNERVSVNLVTEVPEHVGVRLDPGTVLLASPPPRRVSPRA